MSTNTNTRTKSTITVTHPNGEVCSRKTNRDYQYAAVSIITTDRMLKRLHNKMEWAVTERDVWQALKDGNASIDISTNVYRNCVSARTNVMMNNDTKTGISVAIDWDTQRIEYGEGLMREDVTEDQVANMVVKLERDITEIVMAQVDRRIKSATAKVKKIAKEIAHVESLGGTTYAVQSWHSRIDLANNACAKYGTGSYVVVID